MGSLGEKRIVAILGALVAFGPLCIDIYLPALPEIGRALHTNSMLTQFTLSGMLLGLGLGQIVVGPLSDSLGRKMPLALGIVMHIAASMLAATALSFSALSIALTIQGFGASAAMVVTMAMVGDRYDGDSAATMFSRLLLIIGIAPIPAPFIGAAILVHGSWRNSFQLLAVLGLLLLLLATVGLPETLPPKERPPLKIRSIFKTYEKLLHDRVFVALVAIAGLSIASTLAYSAGAVFVLQEQYGVRGQALGIIFGVGSVAFVVGSQLNILALKRFESRTILWVSLSLATVAAVVSLVLSATGAGGLAGFVVPVWTLLTMMGFVIPNNAALALSRHAQAVGTSAAALGIAQFGVGAVVAPMVGAMGNNAFAIAIVMTAVLVLALVSLALVGCGPGENE